MSKERFTLLAAAYLVPIKDNQILLSRRFNTGYKDGSYSLIAGHSDGNESMTHAMIREAKEEAGLDIILLDNNKKPDIHTEDHTELISPRFLNVHTINPTHQHIGLVYIATTKSDNVQPEKPTDIWKWLTIEELDHVDLKSHIRFYAQTSLKEVEYMETL